ncbi:HNH endonuclease [Aneurinibacillus sp. REN35]|uniref:HNH endonuclease n=1 Tax=Aneurinibacillus sp. REN35 TaxID=3237286 RepID=UPI0035294F13
MRPVIKRHIPKYNDNDEYDVLRTYLFKQIGSYCSYCETPISMDSAVEHKVPKSNKRGFQQYQTRWSNLLVACQSCNSAKGTTPDKNEVKGVKGDENLFLATMKLWVWPDRTFSSDSIDIATNDNTYQLFQLVYEEKSQKELIEAGMVKPINTKTWPSWTTDKHKMVWILPNEAYLSSFEDSEASQLRKRALNTLKGLQLNYYNDSDMKFSDRRVINRTKAYLLAQESIDDFVEILSKTFKKRDIEGYIKLYMNDTLLMMLQSMRLMIKTTGFWSVWFTVFRKVLENPTNSYLRWLRRDDRLFLLRSLLIAYIEGERRGNVDSLIFPGLDEERLALNSFQ